MAAEQAAPQGAAAIPKKELERRRAEEFSSLYANNIFLESSVWDLKLIFGELDQSVGGATKEVVLQHTAITIPWNQIKLLIYLLQLHLAAHEAENGRVAVPRNMITPPASEMPQAIAEGYRNADQVWKAINQLWGRFIAENPEQKK